MSAELMSRMREHLNDGSLLSGYSVRFYRWSDADLNKSGQVILFNTPGTGGSSSYVVQEPDVTIQMLCDPDQVKAGDDRMLQILQYFRSDYKSDTGSGKVVSYNPIAHYSGPVYLENSRAMFSLTVRCITEDQ